MKSGFDAVRVENEKLLKLQDNLGWDQARLKAADYKDKVFNSLFNFMMSTAPDAGDIEVIYEERRYEAFWHVLGYANLEYKRKKEYQVNLDQIVKGVEIVGEKMKMEKSILKLSAIETCEENQKEEFLIDANLDKEGGFSKYLKYPTVAISTTDELEDSLIAELKTSSSQLVKRMLLKLVKPVENLEMLREEIVISELSLYFHPLYTFEFYWKAKDKKALVSFDGVTGEIYTKTSKIGDTLKNTFNKDDLFEFGKEIAQNIVPGGGLAVMLGKKMLEISKKK
ncbi:MAG: hypothetical protein ACRCZE_05525 [Candidatus Altimarinota bacterium]